MLLVVSGGAIWDELAGGPPVEPPPEEDGSSFRVTLKRFPRSRTLRKRFVNALEQAATSTPTSLACSLPSTDLFKNPFAMAYALNRPQGAGRTLHPESHAWVTAFRLAVGVVVNQVSSGFSFPIWNATGQPVHTITVAAGGVASQFPVTCPVVEGVNVGTGSDKQIAFYDGASEVFHDFYRYNPTTYQAESHAVYSSKQAGLSPRGTSASGLLIPGLVLRSFEWGGTGTNFVSTVEIQHAIGLAIPGQGATDKPILGRTMQWPATSMDNFAATNTGVVPYGSWWVMPLPSEGGPSISQLGLNSDPQSLDQRAYRQAAFNGWVICDRGSGNLVFRGDQGITSALATAVANSLNKLRPYMRPVSNVGASGSNPIGGGTALANNCAFDRDTPTINSVGNWQSQYSLSADLTAIETTDTRGWNDSWKHYDSSYSMHGNLSMWRATEDTRYLDRCIHYTQAIIDAARLSSTLGSQGFNDNFLGWLGLTHPSNPVQEGALYEVYWWRYVAVMLMEMHDRGMDTAGSYIDEYNTILAFMQQNIWVKWFTRGVNSYLYRTVIHITCHAGLIAMCLKDRATTAAIRTQALTFWNNMDHDGIPVSTPQPYGASVWSQLQKVHPKDANACVWESFWRRFNVAGVNHDTPDPAHPEPDFSDTSHAEAVVTYIVEAYLRGLGNWDLTIIQKIIALWLLVWPNNTTHYKWLIGNNPTDATVFWAPNYNENAPLCGFDLSRALMLRFQTQTGSATVQRYGNAALAALRLGA